MSRRASVKFSISEKRRLSRGIRSERLTWIALVVPPREEKIMHLSNQSLLVIILVGIVAGWLADRVMEGGGFGLIGDHNP